MEESSAKSKPEEISAKIDSLQLPQSSKLVELVRKTQLNNKKLKENMQNLQDALDNLNLIVKYQTFDLEATRRENEHLRKLLEEK